MGELHVVVGGQYGSEGKGAVAGYLTRKDEFGRGMAIRVAGPNAGHSAIGTDGAKYALRQLPVAAVTNPDAMLGIAAGSEIDIDVLVAEVETLAAAGFNVRDRLLIDPSATIIDPDDSALEREAGLVEQVGSTGKGIGSARSNRIWRRAKTAQDHQRRLDQLGAVAPVAPAARYSLRRGDSVLIEGTQGYGLGLHTRSYPQVTSSDCRAIDFLAMAGLSPWCSTVTRFRIWVCYRPYPIRVAGNSGPLREETTWEALGLPSERTTVTQKIRRVGGWDPQLANEAAIANGGRGAARAVLTMADQVVPEIAGYQGDRRSPALFEWIAKVETDSGLPVELIGTGPGTMLDLRRDVV